MSPTGFEHDQHEVAKLHVKAIGMLAQSITLQTQTMQTQTKAILNQSDVLLRLHDAIILAISTFADDIKSDKEVEQKKDASN